MTLKDLKVGSSGVIRAVGGEGILRCRLLDMGLIPHTRDGREDRADGRPDGDPSAQL